MFSAEEKNAPVDQEKIEAVLKSLDDFCRLTRKIVEDYDKKVYSTNQNTSVEESKKEPVASDDFPVIDEERKNVLKDLAISIESQATALDIAMDGIRESMRCFSKLFPELREEIDKIYDHIGDFQDYVLYPDHDVLEYISDKLWEENE